MPSATVSRRLVAGVSLALVAALAPLAASAKASSPVPLPVPLDAVRARPAAGETIYFLMPDRFADGDPANNQGGVPGDREANGYDPTATGWYHGGDLKGVIEHLDYIKGLGATALWITPVFTNQWVQHQQGAPSAGYHGYWITDFTRVDPHLGTNADFAALVSAAHAKGIKVYLDIVVNHTGNLITYAECPKAPCPYRNRADYPWSRRGGLTGPAINAGFAGETDSSPANFAHYTDPAAAYTPVIAPADAHRKQPEWLNNPLYYHNRGNQPDDGEGRTLGALGGLDDLFTEHPRVRAGLIAIYRDWIRRYGIDGYRIDTARHVEPGFWQQFLPAMKAEARRDHIPNFALFGEVGNQSPDSGYIARYVVRDGFPGVLDFAFQAAVRKVLGHDVGTDQLGLMFEGDALYPGGDKTTLALPTFLGNHDMGRFAYLIAKDRPGIAPDELLARVTLGHVMLLTLRGAPVIYYGDEQGFVGHGDDQGSRQDMVHSRTPSYNDQPLLGTSRTTADDNFRPDHPLYQTLARLGALRAAHPALVLGHQEVRTQGQTPGLFSVSRFDPRDRTEYLIAYNTSLQPLHAASSIGIAARGLTSLWGTCPATVAAPGSVVLDLPPLGSAICRVTRTDPAFSRPSASRPHA